MFRLIVSKIMGSIFFSSLAICFMLICHLVCLVAINIWLQQKGVCQFLYFAGYGAFFRFLPWGLRFASHSFSLYAQCGQLSLATLYWNFFILGSSSCSSMSQTFQDFSICYADARFMCTRAHTLRTVYFFLLFVLYLCLRYGQRTPSDLFSSYVTIAQ